jgi:hypothetical protein
VKVKSWAAPLALALVVGGVVGGAALVTGGDGDGSGSSGGRPVLLHLASAGGGRALAASADSADTAAGGQRYVLTGTLPDGTPADRAVYRLRGATADDAATVAAALGLSGTPTRIDGGWALRHGGNRLIVREDGGWSYGLDCAPDTPVSDESADMGCGYAVSSSVASPGSKDDSAKGDGSDPSSGGAVDVPPCEPGPAVDCGATDPQPVPDVSPGPSDAQARAAAEPILAKLGLGDADLTVWHGDPSTTVQASPTVDGMATIGWVTSLQINGDGDVEWADGWVDGAVPGATYPVVSAQDAFDALQSQPQPMMEMCMQRKDGKPGCADIPPAEVTGASPGLLLDYDGDKPMLVPAWLFDVKDGFDPIAQIAVDPSFLAQPQAVNDGQVNGTDSVTSGPAEEKPVPADKP